METDGMAKDHTMCIEILISWSSCCMPVLISRGIHDYETAERNNSDQCDVHRFATCEVGMSVCLLDSCFVPSVHTTSCNTLALAQDSQVPTVQSPTCLQVPFLCVHSHDPN